MRAMQLAAFPINGQFTPPEVLTGGSIIELRVTPVPEEAQLRDPERFPKGSYMAAVLEVWEETGRTEFLFIAGKGYLDPHQAYLAAEPAFKALKEGRG